MAVVTPLSPQQKAQQQQQQNAYARQVVQNMGVLRTSPIYSATINPAQFPVLNIPPAYTGLILGFYVTVTATIANNDGAAAITPTDYCNANIFSNVTFTDPQGNTRINTGGWHLSSIATLKNKRPYANAFLNGAMDCPMTYGSNWNIDQCTASIAHGASGTVKKTFWVPLAYGMHDFRGAVYANIINAAMNLQLTFNPFPGTVQTDNTFSIYQGSNSVVISSATVQISQVYYDQIQIGSNGLPVVPGLDIATVYELKTTQFANGITANNDFYIPYSSYRDFVSSYVIFNNGGTTNGGRPRLVAGVASDVNTWALRSANFTDLFKKDPYLQSLGTRQILGTDIPPGSYYFSHRERPLSTKQFGNMQLVLNAASVGTDHTAYCQVGWEDFALLNTIAGSASLAS